jgi:RNA polymerase sigma-70 factor (ECF subfamily)
LNQETASYDNTNRKIERTSAPASEEQLLSRVAKADETAFSELYQRYELILFNYLLRMVHEREAAEDLLQEVFVAIWNGAGRFRGHSSVKTWIFHIAHNQAVSWLRALRRVTPLEEAEQSSGEEDPEAEMLINWTNTKLRQALDRLSPEHREVVELAFFQDLSYFEIAEIAGCPIGTVKSRMSYARRNLGKILQNIITP